MPSYSERWAVASQIRYLLASMHITPYVYANICTYIITLCILLHICLYKHLYLYYNFVYIIPYIIQNICNMLKYLHFLLELEFFLRSSNYVLHLEHWPSRTASVCCLDAKMFVAHSALTPVWLMRNIQIWSETNSTAGPYPEQHLTLLISLLMHSDARCVHCTLDKPSEHISESQCICCRASLYLVSGKMQKRSLMEAYHCNASTVHLNSAPPLAASALAVKSKYLELLPVQFLFW